MTPAASPSRIGQSFDRLSGIGAFESVFRAGTRHDARYLQLIAARAARSSGRVGYVIGRKMLPRAVDRNRLRRCLRETVRAAPPGIASFDVILRLKRTASRSEIDLVRAEAQQLLARLGAPAA